VSSAHYFTINLTNDFLHQNKDKIKTISPSNEALDDRLPSRVNDPEIDQCFFSQSTDNESNDNITEELALDQFNVILKKAQQVSEQAEKERRKTCKQSRTYNGKSERTLKWCKQFKDNLKQKGFLSVFDFIALTKKKNLLDSKQLQCAAVNSNQI
jgi:hypothetical protein